MDLEEAREAVEDREEDFLSHKVELEDHLPAGLEGHMSVVMEDHLQEEQTDHMEDTDQDITDHNVMVEAALAADV